jgi:dTDP-glucose pyrophosphorylase
MMDYRKHIIYRQCSIKEALKKLNELAVDAILFLIDDQNRLIGSLTDGDIRRGFIKGLDFSSELIEFIQPKPSFIKQNKYNIRDFNEYKKRNFKIVPILNDENEVVDVLNFRLQRSLLPVDALIMAGGEGNRLRPLTERTPKPLLKVGNKPIIEYNLDRLRLYGIRNIYISVRYLADQLIDYFGDGGSKGLNICYVQENNALGTIGAISLIKKIACQSLLVINSDILTNIDFEDFYLTHIEKCSDMSVASVPYRVQIPYAVLETSEHSIISFNEKPTYTYYSNAGIYLIKKDVVEWIPQNSRYNATDLMQEVIKRGGRLVNYPLLGYWLDIGRHEDYEKAQEDIKHIQF